jgi:hypothetical protein
MNINEKQSYDCGNINNWKKISSKRGLNENLTDVSSIERIRHSDIEKSVESVNKNQMLTKSEKTTLLSSLSLLKRFKNELKKNKNKHPESNIENNCDLTAFFLLGLASPSE